MRVLIVKLSSLGDVVHAMPVVHDVRGAFPGALIDWVVEPGFAPLVRRVDGIAETIECALRRWSKSWWRVQSHSCKEKNRMVIFIERSNRLNLMKRLRRMERLN